MYSQGTGKTVSNFVDYNPNPKSGNKGAPLTADKSGLFSYSLLKDILGSKSVGITFELVTTIKKGDYESFDFIQSVASSDPDPQKGDSKTEFYLDGTSNSDKPFYYSPGDRFTAARIVYNNDYQSYFSDGPRRSNFHHYWLGQLTVMGMKNGKWESIFTIRYGYRYTGTEFILIYPVIMAPESNQQGFIKMANHGK